MKDETKVIPFQVQTPIFLLGCIQLQCLETCSAKFVSLNLWVSQAVTENSKVNI